MEDYLKNLRDYSKTMNIDLDDYKIEKFNKYMELLIEWNKKINLTAITNPEEIVLKHFIDSLTIFKYVNDNEKVIDIGTGAGFPGLPLKIANSQINMYLADSLNKRINFLNIVIESLSLNNIYTIHTRIEDLGKDSKYREGFDVVTSRAVASFNVLLEYMLPLLKVGGRCICMKGSNIEEITESQKALEILGGKIEKIEELELPSSDIKRNIIIVKKIKNTPKQYPRKAGIPAKKPIK